MPPKLKAIESGHESVTGARGRSKQCPIDENGS